MFEKNLKLAYLLDFYGDVLDEHSRSVMKSYYDDDLSLAEIAVTEGISRQGVRHIIKRTEEHLEFLEDRLGLAAHHIELESCAVTLRDIEAWLNRLNTDEAIQMSDAIGRIVDLILNKAT